MNAYMEWGEAGSPWACALEFMSESAKVRINQYYRALEKES